MSGHTPGPWRLHDIERATVVAGRPGGEVANCLNGFGDQDANAWLVAASPELLEATNELLKLIRRAQDRLTEYLCPEGSNDPDECMNDLLEMFDGPEQRRIEGLARAAIAKATTP